MRDIFTTWKAQILQTESVVKVSFMIVSLKLIKAIKNETTHYR